VLGTLLYAAVALALTYPLMLHPGTGAISHWVVDLEHSLWVQWWFGAALDSPELGLFSTNRIQFPGPTDLQLADINLAVCFAFYALAKCVGLVLAYNLIQWSSFVLSAHSMWRLCTRVCGSRSAAWTAGLLFAASPYWLCSVLNAWVYLIHIWVFPLALLAISRAAASGRRRDFAWAGLAVGLAFHVTPYYFLFLVVLLTCLLPWHARWLGSSVRSRGGALRLAAGLASLLAVVSPRAVPMWIASQKPAVVHHGPVDTELGARLAELLQPSTADVVARAPRLGFLVVFLSYTLLATLLFGIAVSARRRDYSQWLATAAVMLVLSLGPYVAEPDSAAFGAGFRLPGYFLAQLPGFGFMTNPWRWSLPGVFCLGVVFSLALADCASCFARRRALGARAIAGAAAIAYLAELFWLVPIPRRKPVLGIEAAPIASALAAEASVRAVYDPGPLAKLRQIVHGKAIFGGWLPRIEQTNARATGVIRQDLDGLALTDPRVADYLGAIGFDAIVLSRTEALILRPDAQRAGHFETRLLRAD
jgi:hypothetical protein